MSEGAVIYDSLVIVYLLNEKKKTAFDLIVSYSEIMHTLSISIRRSAVNGFPFPRVDAVTRCARDDSKVHALV